MSAVCSIANTFGVTIDVAAIIAGINSQSAFKGPPKCIRAFEANGFTNTFDTIVPNRKAATRLVETQSLNEIARGDTKFHLEPSSEMPGTKTRLGSEKLHGQIVIQVAGYPGCQFRQA